MTVKSTLMLVLDITKNPTICGYRGSLTILGLLFHNYQDLTINPNFIR
jgi:hypothetical protein